MWSIRRYLLIWLMSAFVVVTLTTAWLSNREILKEINLLYDAQLVEASRTLDLLLAHDIASRNLQYIQTIINDLPFDQQARLNAYKDDREYYHHKYESRRVFQVWSMDHELLLHSKHAPMFPLSDGVEGFSGQIIGIHQWRVYTLVDHKNQLIFEVAQRQDIRNHLQQTLSQGHSLIWLLMFPLLGGLIWIGVGRGLGRLDKIVSEVQSRAPNNLQPVDARLVPSEVRPLIDSLNNLFEQLDKAFVREKRFTADAAHELRTPLAALLTHAQVVQRAQNDADRQKAIDNLLLGVRRASHLVQQLLTLTRLEPEAPINDPRPVSIATLAQKVSRDLIPQALIKDIEVELICDDETALVMGNETALEIMFRNLIDNAIRYTPEEGQIVIHINTSAQYVTFCVTDTGTGIPTELRERVFERFYRKLGTQSEGSGLGLSIVQQIVNKHHASITLETPESGTGLRVRVQFERAHD